MKSIFCLLVSSAIFISCSQGSNNARQAPGNLATSKKTSSTKSGSEDSSTKTADKTSSTDSEVVESEIPVTTELPEGAVAYYFLDESDTGICYDYRFDKEAAGDPEKVGDLVKKGNCPKSVKVDGADVMPLQTCPYLRIEEDGLNIGVILYARGSKEGKSYSRKNSDAKTSCRRWQVLGNL